MLHLVMNGPVWSLIARVDLTGSSSSYHRYYLLDNCIRHFSDSTDYRAFDRVQSTAALRASEDDQ